MAESPWKPSSHKHLTQKQSEWEILVLTTKADMSCSESKVSLSILQFSRCCSSSQKVNNPTSAWEVFIWSYLNWLEWFKKSKSWLPRVSTYQIQVFLFSVLNSSTLLYILACLISCNVTCFSYWQTSYFLPGSYMLHTSLIFRPSLLQQQMFPPQKCHKAAIKLKKKCKRNQK